MSSPGYLAPAPISSLHRLDDFDCGQPVLDAWLHLRALGNEGRTSRTFVIADDRSAVLGYYTLAVGSVIRASLPRGWRHDTPDPVPVMLLARLAVDRRWAGQALGAMMLREAIARTVRVARDAGVMAIVVHAIDDRAASFYRRFGFLALPRESRALFLPLGTLALEATAHARSGD